MMLVLVYLQVSAGLWLLYFACTISSFHAWSDHSKVILVCPRNKTKKVCRVKQINPLISVDQHPKSVYVPASSYKVFLLYDKIFDTMPLSVPFSLSLIINFSILALYDQNVYMSVIWALLLCLVSPVVFYWPLQGGSSVSVLVCSCVGGFVRLFDFALVWFCLFPVPLGVCKRLRSVIVALPGLFFYLFFIIVLGIYSILHFNRKWEREFKLDIQDTRTDCIH